MAPIAAPSPLDGWSEEEAQTVEPATPGGSPGQQLLPSPLRPAQGPTLTENSIGAGTWPPHRRQRAGWTGTSSSTGRGQLTLREERTRGWVGRAPPSPLASVLKHKWQGGQWRPLGDTLGSWPGAGPHPPLLSTYPFWGWKSRPRGGGSLASDLLRAINCEAGMMAAPPHGAAAGPLGSTDFKSQPLH